MPSSLFPGTDLNRDRRYDPRKHHRPLEEAESQIDRPIVPKIGLLIHPPKFDIVPNARPQGMLSRGGPRSALFPNVMGWVAGMVGVVVLTDLATKHSLANSSEEMSSDRRDPISSQKRGQNVRDLLRRGLCVGSDEPEFHDAIWDFANFKMAALRRSVDSAREDPALPQTIESSKKKGERSSSPNSRQTRSSGDEIPARDPDEVSLDPHAARAFMDSYRTGSRAIARFGEQPVRTFLRRLGSFLEVENSARPEISSIVVDSLEFLVGLDKKTIQREVLDEHIFALVPPLIQSSFSPEQAKRVVLALARLRTGFEPKEDLRLLISRANQADNLTVEELENILYFVGMVFGFNQQFESQANADGTDSILAAFLDRVKNAAESKLLPHLLWAMQKLLEASVRISPAYIAWGINEFFERSEEIAEFDEGLSDVSSILNEKPEQLVFIDGPRLVNRISKEIDHPRAFLNSVSVLFYMVRDHAHLFVGTLDLQKLRDAGSRTNWTEQKDRDRFEEYMRSIESLLSHADSETRKKPTKPPYLQ